MGAWVNPRLRQVQKKPRGVILLVQDTLRYDHTSVYGYKRKITPNLERLAADGVTFENAFSSTYWGNDLFVFLHTYQIHAPYKAPSPYIAKINPDLKDNLTGPAKYIKKKQNYYQPLAEKERQDLIDLYDSAILYTDDVLVGA